MSDLDLKRKDKEYIAGTYGRYDLVIVEERVLAAWGGWERIHRLHFRNRR